MSPLLQQLMAALRCLPGVGPKSAQRMALHLLQRERDNGHELARILQRALTAIGHCQVCRNLTEDPICNLCDDPKRKDDVLCIVENPQDIIAIEQTAHFRGKYFVLMGHLSPLDGIGPQELGLHELAKRLNQQSFVELILATNPTVEGEATAHYIANLAKPYAIKITRLASGIPMGGELDYIDNTTLSHAFMSRTAYSES